ncbi:MAG: hypothetical protein ACOC8L_06485 [Spirochaetota bacterium]
MGEYSKSLPEQVRKHLRALAKSVGLGDMPDADEQLARGWHAKHQAFRSHTENHEMVTADYFQAANPGGALAMTYSGSILSVGPIVDGGRAVAYASVGIRQDVPQMSISQDVHLTTDLKRGESATFDAGSIQQTSPIFAIAIFQRALDPLDEKNALAEITDLLAEQFVAINQDTVSVQS